MEEKSKMLANSCSFANIKPAMVDLPYPPIQVKEQNCCYANLLSIDYCGSVSELSAITQYINNENRMAAEKCSLARTILGIAVAEMIHLQMLGELIYLLGGELDFVARHQDGNQKLWTPACLTIPGNIRKMLCADIESEKDAIRQYEIHIRTIKDEHINAVLERIIKDEEYHIMMLQALLEEV